jgi:SAM-dependent methyltransferase
MRPNFFLKNRLFSPINRKISPNDGMYIDGRENHYFSVGRSAIKNVKMGLTAAGLDSPKRILDMACGHGRVLRMLRASFPKAKITACDVDTDAVDFCGKTFGAEKIYSDINFESINLPGDFDLIWCGSLFTHLDRPYWERLIKLCHDHLSDGGVLIFSTHGRYVIRVITEFQYYYGFEKSQADALVDRYTTEGFGYINYPGMSHFGFSISSPSWVISLFDKTAPLLQLCAVTEKSWDRHHDVFAYCRSDDETIRRLAPDVDHIVAFILSKLDEKKAGKDLQDPEFIQEISEWIKSKVRKDKTSYGDRLEHILIKTSLDKLRKTAR